MKKLFSFFVFSILALPAVVLAVDYGGPYSEPTCEPPACNVAAPINVGSSLQDKLGSLRIASALVSNGLFTYSPTASFIASVRALVGYFGPTAASGEDGRPGAGKVLASVDNYGNSFWVSMSSLCSQTGACGGGGIGNGSVQGQTIYWDIPTKTWKKSLAVFVTNNAAGTKQSFQIGNSVPNSADDSFYVAGNSNFQGKVKINTPTTATTDKNGDVLTLIDATTGEADWRTPTAGTGGGSSPWTINGNNIYNSNTGPVGIGTGNNLNSSYKLQVEGAVSVSKDNFLTFGNGLAKNSSQDASINMTPLGAGVNSLDLQGGYISVAPYVGKLIRMFDIVQVGTAVYVDKICNRLGQNCQLVDNIGGGTGLPTGTDKATLRFDGTQNKWVANTALTNDGSRVGIGTLTPNVKLSLGTDITQKKLAIYDGVNNFYGLGLRNGFLDYLAGDQVRMTIAGGTGNVGIGTNNPSVDLEINKDKVGTTEVRAVNSNGGQATAQVGAYNGNNANAFEDGIRIITTGPGYVNSGNNDPAFTPDTAILRSGANLRGLNISANSGDIAMFVGGDKALTVSRAAAGNIGVGIDAPTTKIDVAADTNGISLRSRGNLLLNSGISDGARVVWRGGPNNASQYRARVGTDGSLDFFHQEGALNTALTLNQPNPSIDPNVGVVYAPILQAGAFKAVGAVTNSLQIDTSGSAVKPAPNKILTSLDDKGRTAWKTPAEIGIGGGTSYTAGTGISIANNVITNTAPNINQKISLSGNVLTLDNGGGSVTLPSSGGTTYTAGAGIAINAANQIANTHVINLSGNTLTLSPNGGSVTLPTELPVNPADGSTLYYRQDNSKWMVNPYLSYSDYNVLNLSGQFNANKVAAGTLQITGGSGKIGQVLTSIDALGSVAWRDVPSLPNNATKGDTLYFNGTTWVKNTQLVTDGGNIGIKNNGGAAALANNTAYSLQVGGGILSDSFKTGVVTITTGAGDGKVLTSDSTGKASWQNPNLTATFDNVASTDKVNGVTKNSILLKVVEDNNWLGWGARDFAIMTCPSGYNAIAGGAICNAGENLSANGPGDSDTQWRVSCGTQLNKIQRVKVTCARAN